MTTPTVASQAAAGPPVDASGASPSGTGSTATRVLGLVTLAGFVLLLVLAFVVTPPEQVQRDAVRLLYVHVPSVLSAYLACLVVTVGSVGVLWKGSEWWDLTALASARIAALLTGITLVTGAIWGRATWGVFWVWDARLTSTSMLMILLLGYLALRQLPSEGGVASRRAAVLGLLLIPNIVLIHQSVKWWRSLHQDPTILRSDFDARIDDAMLFTLFLGIVVFALAYVWLAVHGFRVAWLERQASSAGLEQALAERRAEGTTASTGPPAPGAGSTAASPAPGGGG